MDALRSFFEHLKMQLSQFWEGLSTGRKALVGAVAVGTILGLGTLISVRDSKPYMYLFQDLAPEDAQEVIGYFKRNSIENWDQDARGIKVPEDQAHQLRLKLAQEGLPTNGVVGWERFDQQDFTRTDFVNQVLKMRAIQGELQRTIQMIDSVTTAKVHIVAPQRSLFVADEKEPTAAVYLKTKRGSSLDKKQIKGIQHLVSRSVEVLKTTNVTVIDQEGIMLTDPEPDSFSSKMTKERLAYKQALERKFENAIRLVVGRVVGPDRIEAKVDVEVDFTQEQQTISEVDPDNSAVIGKETQGYSLEGTGLNPTGIPGAKSNVPGEQEEIAVNANSTSNKKESEKINYEISKTVSQKTMPIGNIVQLSAAVLVDGKQDYPIDGTKPIFEARSAEEIAQIEKLAMMAINYDDKRGDKITVQNMMFQLDHFQIETIREEKKEKREYLVTLMWSALVSLALVCFFAFVVRPYFRWLSYDPERKKEQQAVEEFKPDLELGALQNVQIKEDVPFEKLTPTEQVLYLAKNEPKRTTEALRLMLNPHHGG